jgi:thymidylate kinase
MIAVALIGADGAGKTTIAQMLQTSSGLPIRYMYMGFSMQSTNIALPTSRLAESLRMPRVTNHPELGAAKPNVPKGRGILWNGMRLANRLAEEWYRQGLSLYHRKRGQIVIYDRYFRFDYEYDPFAEGRDWADRLHRWLLNHFYPKPDLVIFLDAPAEVLYARKGDANVPWLDARRQAFLRQGSSTPNFIRIDATQPLETVYQQVCGHIRKFYLDRVPHRSALVIGS